MKRNRILVTAALVLLLLLSLAGCDFFNAMFSPVVGEWTLHEDWPGTWSDSSYLIEFKWNQGFEQPSHKGTWSQDGDEITFEDDDGTVYTGILDSDQQRMDGTMESYSSTGVWYALKNSGSDMAARAGLQAQR